MATKPVFNPIEGTFDMVQDLSTLSGTYLNESLNLSDLDNVGTARTNLGLVAGGAGDIWVEKAGDTMTGNLSVDANVDVSGKMAVGSGAVLGGSTGRSILALEETTNLSGFGEYTPALEFTAITTGTGILSIPIGLSATARIDSSGAAAQLRGIQVITEQNSTATLANSWGLFVQLKSNAGTGGMGQSAGVTVTSQYSGGAPSTVKGIDIREVSHASTTTAYGLYVEKQALATNNYGISLAGDGVGSDLVLGAGQDASIYYDGTDLILNPNLVGTGKVLIGAIGDNTIKAKYESSDGSAGLSATYSFGGGGAGDISTMTFKDGILTAVTTI